MRSPESLNLIHRMRGIQFEDFTHPRAKCESTKLPSVIPLLWEFYALFNHPFRSFGAYIVKCQTRVVLILLSIVAIIAGAQTAPQDQGAQETQVRGYWTDPSTGLMWAGKDNGKNVNWKNAVKYCRNLRLAGYSNWRLATIRELEGICDKNVNAPGRDGQGASTWHVKGNIFLTGNQWSSTQLLDDRGHPSGWAPRFDFNDGRVFNGDEITFYSFKRALCVRGSGK